MEVELDRIVKEQKEQRRMLENILSVVNRTYKDREIAVDTHESIIGLKERMIADRTHQDTSMQDVKAEVSEVKAKVDDNTVIIKAPRQSIVDKVLLMMKGGKK